MPLTEPIRWTLLIWLTVLGGCVGSFLNVVVYRLPRGQSLVHPGSRCPGCGHAIRWWHNLPVVGWLLLRGRCYDCGERINVRYPVVEAIVAFWFGTLAAYGPLASPDWLMMGPGSKLGFTVAGLWCLYGFHVLLCCSLICLVLIDFDSVNDHNVRYSAGLWVTAMLCGLLASSYDIRMHPVRICGVLGNGCFLTDAAWYVGPLEAAIGAGLGVLIGLGFVFIWRLRSTDGHGGWRPAIYLALIGIFLGWSGVVVAAGAAAVAAMVAIVVRSGPGRTWRWNTMTRWVAVAMLLGATAWMFCWKQLLTG